MKKLTTALAAVTLFASATSAIAAPVCLDSLRIRNTSIPDAKHIVFHMTDGTTWSNELKNRCPGLRWNGFVYEPFAGRDVCENLQTVVTIWDNQPCMLGKFTKQAPAHA